MAISPTQMPIEMMIPVRAAVSERQAGTGQLPAQDLQPPSAPAPATSMKIDEHHQVYYEFREGGTGNVMFEIPPEALRRIAESLTLPQVTENGVPALNVKS